jgi:hypothetical protein
MAGRLEQPFGADDFEDADEEDDDESDEELMPRAFAVEGEPNFEAGPPADAQEYLRRVRCPLPWARCQLTLDTLQVGSKTVSKSCGRGRESQVVRAPSGRPTHCKANTCRLG